MRRGEKPLALYVFSESQEVTNCDIFLTVYGENDHGGDGNDAKDDVQAVFVFADPAIVQDWHQQWGTPSQ